MFEEVCPYYLQYGMTYDQFWHGDPWMVRAYRKKWRLQLEKENRDMWLQGLYNYNAVSTAMANAFSKKKHSYIEEPLQIFPETKGDREERIRLEYQKTMNQLMSLAAKAGYKERK